MAALKYISVSLKNDNEMLNTSLFYSYFFLLIIVVFDAKSQKNSSLSFQCTLWDSATGVDLKSEVYAIADGKKIKLGDSNDLGVFDLKIPTNIQYLIFESKGYETIKQPVHFVGSFTKPSKFNLGIQTNKLGTTKPKFITDAYMGVPDAYPVGTQFEIYYKEGRSFRTNFTDLIERKLNLGSFDSSQNKKDFILVVTSKEGNILMERKFSIKEGLYFIDANIYPNNEPAKVTFEKIETIFDNRTLYFDQSSYDLKTEAKAILDSAAFYLLNHQEEKILVVGYTDNVGSREPNIILSEYRARASAGYLQKKGVSPTQIITKWEGPNQPIEAASSPDKGAKNRRVVLEIIK